MWVFFSKSFPILVLSGQSSPGDLQEEAVGAQCTSKPHTGLSQERKCRKEKRESGKRREGGRKPNISVGLEEKNGLSAIALQKQDCGGQGSLSQGQMNCFPRYSLLPTHPPASACTTATSTHKGSMCQLPRNNQGSRWHLHPQKLLTTETLCTLQHQGCCSYYLAKSAWSTQKVI